MKRQGFHHRKLRRLARTLRAAGSPNPMMEARGAVEGLSYVTATSAPHGDLGRIPDDDIEDEIGWEGEPGGLIAALLDAGFLELSDEHRLVVHDWPEHADKHVHRIVLRSLRPFADGTPPRVSEGTAEERRAWHEAHASGDTVGTSRGYHGDTTGTPPGSRKDTGGESTGSKPEARSQKPEASLEEEERYVGRSAPSGVAVAWEAMRTEAERAGASWPREPGKNQRKLITSRLRDYTPEQLAAAVRGYVARNGTEARGDFDPRRYFTVETILRPTKIDANIQAASAPPGESELERKIRERNERQRREAAGA